MVFPFKRTQTQKTTKSSIRTGKDQPHLVLSRFWYAIAFVAAFAILGGGYLIFHGHAATPTLPSPLYSGGQAPWIQPIGTNPVLDPNSAAMVNSVDSRVNPTMNDFGMPFYTGTASDPTCTVQDADNTNQPGKTFMPIHIPSNAQPSNGSDHWLFVYDSVKNVIIEMWDTSKSGNCFSTQVMNAFTPTGDGVLQTDGSTTDGNGASYWGGVVSAVDWNRGYINHALSLASQATTPNVGRYPMNQQTDGSNGNVPIGSRFFLDKSVNCDGLGASKVETMVCHAMQTYGGYMQDTGGVPMSIYFQENNSTGGIWSGQGWSESMAFSKIPWNQMHVLKSWNSYTPVSTPPSPSPAPAPSPTPSPTPSPSPSPSPAPSPSPSPTPSPKPSPAPAPSPTPSPTPSPSPSPSPSGGGTTTGTGSTPTTTSTTGTTSTTTTTGTSGSSTPTLSLTSSPCHEGQNLQNNRCVCPSGANSPVCNFARFADPIVNIAGAVLSLLLIVRIVSGIMTYNSMGGNPAWAAYSKRRILIASLGLALTIIIYVILQFIMPGAVFNK